MRFYIYHTDMRKRPGGRRRTACGGRGRQHLEQLRHLQQVLQHRCFDLRPRALHFRGAAHAGRHQRHRLLALVLDEPRRGPGHCPES